MKKIFLVVFRFPNPNERFTLPMVIRNTIIMSAALYGLAMLVGFWTLPENLRQVRLSIWLLLGAYLCVFVGLFFGGWVSAFIHNRKIKR